MGRFNPQVDPSSATWEAVETLCSDAMQHARQALEQPNCPERTADLVRGRIALAKEILALSKAVSADK